MSEFILTGKGGRRKRYEDSEWEDVNGPSGTTLQIEGEEEKKGQGTLPKLERQEDSLKINKDNGSESRDFKTLRDISRREYLKNRLESKLEQLSEEILAYELSLKQLSKEDKKSYQEKLKIYNAIKERNDVMEADLYTYQPPTDYMTADGKLDRKRKLELLISKARVYEDGRTKKNKYETQWEAEQMEKAKQLQLRTDEIKFGDQKQYEFVFDEDQFLDFDEDEALEGDENHGPPGVVQKNMTSVKQLLPVFSYRREFLDAVRDNQVLIVVGETGSGKTTQLPQYLFEEGYTKGNNSTSLQIACTQPRRVAATSVATRVAEEMNVKLGEEVGYTIRFEDKSSEKTIIRYLTDGMLLREFLADPELLKYSAIMIDEAHERTLSTEILLSLLKDIMKLRKDLKLIVASATINAKSFSEFFNNAPVFNIPGRRFPVDIHYTKNPEANYIQAAITTIFQIHTTQDINGDILVFLTGQDEIETIEESLNESISMLGSSIQPMEICPLYANLPPELQSAVFKPTAPNTRKVVLATNIAETSITIDGIKFVIDPGYVKQNVFNASTGMESLVVVPCSRASANQRAGRAGRVGPGKCFRLYTKWSFYNEIEANSTPEILRTNLTTTILLLLSLGINDLVNFDFMDRPSPNALMRSLELLYSLGALNSKGQLTKLGRTIAEFPIDAMLAKCLIFAARYNVVEEILSIISMVSESSNLFYRPKDKKEQADKKKEYFNQPEGDQLTLLNIWEQWEESGFSKQWCEDNFIQYKTMKRTKAVREQLKHQCNRHGVESFDGEEKLKDYESKTVAIQKVIVSGYFSHICRLSKMGDSYINLKRKQTVYIHPSSSLYSVKPPPKLVLYHELVLTSKEFMRNCMIVDDKWVSEFGAHYYSKSELESISSKRGVSKLKV
ncbi:uncharacterized protein PRCAT00002589001 [Priceomyces carsonii]|uniref:uncharacterized protein n=1 Tax=Priceomyces carsonii TaxID=28549 RepID=UPI002ED91C1B|nr:unnamed protein product [Priceomyces carsonii]